MNAIGLGMRFLALAIFLLLNGCGTYRAAGLENLAPGEASMLVMPYAPPAGIFVTHIDCKSRGVGWYRQFDFHPGWRIITFMGNDQLYVPPNPKSFIFRAGPGAVYTFERDYQYRSDDWIIVILDEETGEPIESTWQRAEWSYWTGAKPDSGLCKRMAELNLKEFNKQN